MDGRPRPSPLSKMPDGAAAAVGSGKVINTDPDPGSERREEQDGHDGHAKTLLTRKWNIDLRRKMILLFCGQGSPVHSLAQRDEDCGSNFLLLWLLYRYARKDKRGRALRGKCVNPASYFPSGYGVLQHAPWPSPFSAYLYFNMPYPI